MPTPHPAGADLRRFATKRVQGTNEDIGRRYRLSLLSPTVHMSVISFPPINNGKMKMINNLDLKDEISDV